MYWSAYGMIQGAEMDGSNQRVITLLPRSNYGHYPHQVQGLALDIPNNRIYFICQSLSSLMYVDLNHGNRTAQTLFGGKTWYPDLGAFGIAVDEQYVYFVLYYGGYKVYRTNKTRSDGYLQLTIDYYPRGIIVQKGKPTRNGKYNLVLWV